MSARPNWLELETRGFVVVRPFLSATEVAMLRDDFAKGAPPSLYPHGFKLMGRRSLESLWPTIGRAAREVGDQTFVKVDLITFLTFSHYVVTERTERTSFWHQDFDFDYKITLDHINYLNFYIPIIKPRADKSNVCVIPFEALREKSSDAFGKLRGAGGHRLIPQQGRTAVYGNYGGVLKEDDDENKLFELDFDIEDLAVAPSLDAGDLLLMRGDIIHRTQDADTKRVSASIRVTNSKKAISRERLPANASNASDPSGQLEGAIVRCFEAMGRSDITIEEFVNFSNGRLPRSPAPE